MRYFVVVGGADEGPFTFDQLKSLAAKGELSADSVLRPEAGGDALLAVSLGGLIVEPPPPGHYTAPNFVPATLPPTSTGRHPVVIAAIVLAGLCVACVPIMGAILFPVFAQARIAAQQTVTLGHLKQITTAVLVYATDYDDRLPAIVSDAATMRPLLSAYIDEHPSEGATRSVYESLNEQSRTLEGNGHLSGVEIFKVEKPALTLLFFDAADWQGGKRCVGLVDGSAKKLVGPAVHSAFAVNKGVLSPLDLPSEKN